MSKRGRPAHPDRLTPAEWRVVEGVRHGLTNPAIAKRCGITQNAVKFHVSSALGKLGFDNRRELRQWAGVRADSALAAAQASLAPQAWSLGQVARTARDLPTTADWLRDIVKLPELFRLPDMAFFDCGGVRLYLSQGNTATNSILYFKVSDIHAEVDRLRAAGVTITSAPHRVHVYPNGTEEWMAFFNDPDDGALALTSIVKHPEGEVA